jgi:predicted CoA-substrate-specific enzyme activase
MCTYSKAVLEECLNKNINEIILVNCCDSIRRLYDVLKKHSQFKFVHIIDLPRKINLFSKKIFLNELINFISSYEVYSNKKFSEQKLKKFLQDKSDINKTKIKCDKCLKKEDINIALIGARCNQSLINSIENTGSKVLCNLTCTGEVIDYSNYSGCNNVLLEYAKLLLNSYPCMRMTNIKSRHDIILNNEKLSGIIYHSVKFCDYYSYDFADLKLNCNLPILKIETDYTNQCEGQIKTRIEAFIESLNNKYSKNKKENFNLLNSKLNNYYVNKKNNITNTTSKSISAGIDIGSTSTNVVIMDEYKNILSTSIVKTGAKSTEGACNAISNALKKANLTLENLTYIISTGYGRISVPFANETITEITCHGKGAHFLNPNIRTIIDIGGQDSKVINLDNNGNIVSFAMNDKCAAGTGRFLEMMARTLEIDLQDMGKESLKWKEDIAISSMCTVFAESEVVSLIAENKEKADIIHGLCNSIAGKTISLLNRVDKKAEYMMTGGVAKNIGVIKCLENKLGHKIYIADEPQIVGALGAALFALDKISLK